MLIRNEDRKTPMLDPKVKNEQKIEDQDYQKEANSKPHNTKKSFKEDPDKIPESNDPAGYGECGNVKKSPYEKEK